MNAYFPQSAIIRLIGSIWLSKSKLLSSTVHCFIPLAQLTVINRFSFRASPFTDCLTTVHSPFEVFKNLKASEGFIKMAEGILNGNALQHEVARLEKKRA